MTLILCLIEHDVTESNTHAHTQGINSALTVILIESISFLIKRQQVSHRTVTTNEWEGGGSGPKQLDPSIDTHGLNSISEFSRCVRRERELRLRLTRAVNDDAEIRGRQHPRRVLSKGWSVECVPSLLMIQIRYSLRRSIFAHRRREDSFPFGSRDDDVDLAH